MLKIGVLVSGGGTNFQAIIDGVESGEIPDSKIVKLISSNPKAYAIERAKKHNIDSKVIDKTSYNDNLERTKAIISELKEAKVDLIVLAGYMQVLGADIIKEFQGRIINIHPSLIPKYSGKGFYGKHVHEAVIAAGEKESGATVHFVDEGVDTGEIIIQKKVPVLKEDQSDSLAKRVLEVEHEILVKAIADFARK